jgi:hypothetical protein
VVSRLGEFFSILLVERVGWHEPRTKIAPSYMPPSVFSAAVLEILMTRSISNKELSLEGFIEASRERVAEEELSPEGFIKALRKRVAHANGSDALLSILRTTLATQGSSIQAVRLAIEKWFNDSMDRASGWYKRRTQVWLLAFGLLIAMGGHVDTIAISQWLWSGDAARQSVMGAAQSYVDRGNSTSAATPTADDMTKYFKDVAEQMGDVDRQITNLQYPIGWYDPTKNKIRDWSWQFFVGALITAIAISMGSTFWFDALQSLIKIRGAGPKPGGR